MNRIMILVALLAVIAGCGTPFVLPVDQEYNLESLYPPGDNEFRTYAALLLSLKDRKWIIKDLDLEKGVFEAEYCHKVSTNCMTIRGHVQDNWKIIFLVVDNNFDDRHAFRFIDNLQRSFQKYSNLSTILLTDKIDDTVFWDTIKSLQN